MSFTSANSALSSSSTRSTCRSITRERIQRPTSTLTSRRRRTSRGIQTLTFSPSRTSPMLILCPQAALRQVTCSSKSNRMSYSLERFGRNSMLSLVITWRKLTPRSRTSDQSRQWWARWSQERLKSRSNSQTVCKGQQRCLTKWSSSGRLSWKVKRRRCVI